MTTYNNTGIESPIIFNKLTKTQLNNATELSNTEQYLVDPEFAGNKLLITDANGDIVEGTLSEGNIVTTDTAQDITATKTFRESTIYDGIVVQRDSNTAGAFVAFSNNSGTIGAVGMVPSKVPVATSPGESTYSIVRGGVYTSPAVGDVTTPVYVDSNGVAQAITDMATTDTAQTFTGLKQFNVSDVTNSLCIKRANSTTAGTAIRFENNAGVLGGLGYSGGALPYCTSSDNTSNNIIVRCGSASAPAVGNTSTPVYIDTDGIAQECTGVQEKVTVTTISSNDSITLADNTCFKGGSISAFTITVPLTTIYPFVCEIDFTSPSTATTITYSGTIVWDSNSDDLINDVFVPATNKDYTIMFWFNGTNYCGTVTGV